MTPLTMKFTEELVVTHCWCGIALAIPQNLYRVAHEDKHDVYCPLGHTFVWHDTYRDKLEREQRKHKATKDLLAYEERSHAATRGHLTRAKKRSAAGVCPCCHRTFKQLRKHMNVKHPEYVAEAKAAKA